MTGYNWFDYMLMGVLAVAVITSIQKGFLKEVVSLAALVVGLFCALWFYGIGAAFIMPYVSHPGIANFLGFILILVLFGVLSALIQWGISKLLKLSGLTWVDRAAGGCFGLVKGVLLAAIIILAVSAFAPGRPPKVVANSRLSPYLMGTASAMCALAPREVREGFHESYRKAKEIWAQAIEQSPIPLPSREL